MSLGKVGKFLYTVPFLAFGSFHFLRADGLIGLVPKFLPVPEFWLYGTGLCFLAGAIGVLTGRRAALAMKLLSLLLLAIIVMIQIPMVTGDNPAMASAFQTPMILSIGLMGASLALSETVE